MNFPALFDAVSPAIRDTLGEPVILRRAAGGEDITLQGKFDADFLLQAVVDGVGMDSRRPVFEYRTSDHPGIVRDDAIVARGLTYAVVDIQPVQNFTLLILEKRS